MEPIVLTDPNVRPDEELVFGILGEKSVYWEQLIDYVYDNHFDISEEWRFYNDGKAWLYRALRKKKTIYWIGVISDTFRVTFWFGDKAEPAILASSLPDGIKNDFLNAKKYGKIRSISVEIRNPEDLQNVLALVELSVKIK